MAVLYVVGTPIGNLEDMTLRALRILKEVDLIACEDTRVTKKLLVHYQINKPLVSYHQHSQISKINFLIQELMVGKKVALVTDAGMPGISDPGSLLVKAAVQENIKVEVIPGPSAATAALSVSGLPVDRFLFLGFLPHKKGRETMIKEIIASEQSVIFYESVHRILKTLGQLKQFGLKRQLVVCRELTKKFESIYRGTVEEVLEQLLKDRVKGEFVVIVSNK
ncbi:MAG: 16S rRNA (cytidine(1402)-2'-O)-methyltransferase [Candidatus Buchananbacteria bacterium RIFCSPHIGHO2_01_FULL_39_14]|uniref:Ribosomal RNA small subunit methyltransferase I n=2 Tax=Candidatus Buchananiibacteriota TaxID=1817903 RepID=A0A1G1YTL0_9BACT|nr:MAG: 16S rRNA (cytidine(1402)-2'-O)-methyltransferase [Candidatus Buchananbacteria bacterium RIFCSPHIGHO2_01_FULL_39_14]OGY49458.1 MAG: 16S rRNA (cytidine(1402)-2'-O)-methyltransferase [Candidatus Buchananbacteria bacterium RIFCSPHIGHO2_02_FULL_39_17]OGY55619.1 MAG: 16S rRNA (cytidine(1402)-2'-O)-methyltransferase [Candidatus Buchananbacteria bacterium RIFCSPLOWO2_01_FULL_40_23b]